VTNNPLTDILSEPLNGVTTAKVEINTGSGNLAIDTLPSEEQVLVSGRLQYFEKQGRPTRSVSTDHDQAIFELKGKDAGRPWFRFPWADCNGATEWQIRLNPAVSSDITAHSGGGNVKLNLAGMTVICRLSADTGGGNVDVVLPDNARNLSADVRTGAGNVGVEVGSGTTGCNTVNASSGAGNVTVRVPRGVATRIHAHSGLGKVVVESPLSTIDGQTYESPDYDAAANKVEITVKSGAGNVSVNTR
jgi:hypothetical protein